MSFASQLGTFSVTIRKRIISLIFPIFIISLLSGVCSMIIFGYFNSESGGGGGPPPATPIPSDTPGAALLNALFYVGIAFIGAFSIFLIFKHGKIRLLKALFAIAISVTAFFFVFLFIYSAPYYFLELLLPGGVFRNSTQWIILISAIVLGLAYSLFTVCTMVYRLLPEPLPQIMALLFAVLSGTFLATFLPLFASIFVMIGLSIYDIISVFKGPIRKMAEVSEERYFQEQNQSKLIEGENITQAINSDDMITETAAVSNQNTREEYYDMEYIELGLGDLAFFGMLFSFALIRLGFFSAIGAFIGVIIGAIGTIKLLEKFKMMPGLPLSIGLGLIFAFGVWGTLALSGYSAWGWYPL